MEGKLLAVGLGTPDELGEIMPLDVVVGGWVLFDMWSGWAPSYVEPTVLDAALGCALV